MLKEPSKIISTKEVTGSFIALLRTFNLPTLIEKTKQKMTWSKDKLHSMVLLNRPDKKIVLTSFDEGTEIDSFQSNDSLTLQVIQGKLKFNSRKKSTTLNQGQFFTLYEKTYYRLTTSEKTVFLITLLTGKRQQSEN